METESLLTIVLIIILLEYIFRLKGQVEKKAEEKFEKWKAEYLVEEARKAEGGAPPTATSPSEQPKDQ